MTSMIGQHPIQYEISNSFSYQWINDLNQKTVKKLGKTPEKAKRKLLDLIKNNNIKTSDPEKLADLLITIWIRGKQAIDMIKYTDFKKDRVKLKRDIKKAKKFTETIKFTRDTCTMISLLDLDLGTSFDFDKVIQANEKYIAHIELTLSQNFQRGNGVTSYEHINELSFFTMFYIGEELLQLKQQGNPNPLFKLIKIMMEIYNDVNEQPLGEEKISKSYKRYGEIIEEALEKPISGERLGVNYSIKAYQMPIQI